MEERLSFASYVKCLEVAMQKPYNQDFELTQLLLEFLLFKGTDYEARGRKGCGIDINKTMVSNLLNNKENVHTNIRDNCDLDIAINGIEGYFNKEIYPVISPHMRDDLIENMVKLIKADTSISKVKKKEFTDKAEKENISGFLSSVFLYVVRKDNMTEKQMERDRIKISDPNEQYYNSFVENLFLHKEKGSKTVRLKDLFIMPKYEEFGMPEYGKTTCYFREQHDNDVVDYISKFSMHVIKDEILKKERNQGEVLFIEGDAGVGKTSLVSYLSYLYIAKKDEWKQLFQNKMLLCIRLRDIIPEGMRFSSDTIIKEILKYLNLDSVEDFRENYKNPLIVLDGFDELCMVEGINANSEYYIYQIINTFWNYKLIITTRPQYLNVEKLNITKKHIVLLHFDASQRREWVDKYQKTGILEYEETGIEYILDEKNEEIDSICDTPMVMYMIVAGGISEEAKHNKWLLYHQIFYKELSDTEYNSMFYSYDGAYNHGIKKHQELLYRLSAEISQKMFCSGNQKLFLNSDEISDIVDDLKIEDIKLKEIVQHCYALCNYWKSNGKGAVEFYHNNIRDFFLCEKIFYEFNSMYQVCETLDKQKMITYITGRIYDLFRYIKLPYKVMEFLYLRAKYNYEHHITMDFPTKEYKRKYLSQFFSDMLQYGGVSRYDRNSKENVYDNMVNVLSNTVRIFRCVLELYLIEKERIQWYNNADWINQADILRRNFREIFISGLLIVDNKKISLTGKANFSKLNLRDTNLSEVDLSGADLRGADLRDVNLTGSNLSEADLSGADLSSVNLSRANLRNTYLSNADLSKANLQNADLRNADLGDIDMSDAKLIYADLRGAYLRCAKLEGANLKGVKLCNAVLQDGFKNDNQIIQLKHLSEMQICRLLLEPMESDGKADDR